MSESERIIEGMSCGDALDFPAIDGHLPRGVADRLMRECELWLNGTGPKPARSYQN